MRTFRTTAALSLLLASCATTVVRDATSAGTAAERCEAVLLEIVVINEELRVNGAPFDLDALRLAAQEKAAACEGVTPRGSSEGPNHISRVTSMIWPILDEELPDLELEVVRRRKGGG